MRNISFKEGLTHSTKPQILVKALGGHLGMKLNLHHFWQKVQSFQHMAHEHPTNTMAPIFAPHGHTLQLCLMAKDSKVGQIADEAICP